MILPRAAVTGDYKAKALEELCSQPGLYPDEALALRELCREALALFAANEDHNTVEIVRGEIVASF